MRLVEFKPQPGDQEAMRSDALNPLKLFKKNANQGGPEVEKRVLCIMAAMFISTWIFNGVVHAGQFVRIPYMVAAGGWSTGVAITNLSGSEITNLTLDMVKENGEWHNAQGNYSTNLGTLEPYAMMTDFIKKLYGKTWADTRFWGEIWHTGPEEFAVTVFVMNVTTGQAEGFGFYPFFSESRAEPTIPSFK